MNVSSNDEHPIHIKFKLAVNLFTIVILFVVCLTPYLVLNIVISFDRFRSLQNPAMMRAYVGLFMIVMLNSLVNPIVYAFRFKNFKIAFKLLFGLIKDEDRAAAIESAKWINAF